MNVCFSGSFPAYSCIQLLLSLFVYVVIENKTWWWWWLTYEGARVWKSSQWTPASRSWLLLGGFNHGQYEVRLAVRSDVTQGPTSTGPSRLVSVYADRASQQGTKRTGNRFVGYKIDTLLIVLCTDTRPNLGVVRVYAMEVFRSVSTQMTEANFKNFSGLFSTINPRKSRLFPVSFTVC